MPQAKKTPAPTQQVTGTGRQVLRIAIPAAGSRSPLKLKKKQAAQLAKAFKKAGRAADDAGLDVTSDLEVLAAAAEKARPAPSAAAAAAEPSAATAPSGRPAPPPRAKPAAVGSARKRPVKRAADATTPTTSAEPTLVAGVGTPTGAPAPRPRRVLKRTPARPPVTP